MSEFDAGNFNERFNADWVAPGEHSYNTDLGVQEPQFQEWVKTNNVPFDMSSPTPDYDMRGFYGALQAGDPRAMTAINPNDKQIHYPDYWKTPYHESFSNESQWANPQTAPRWQGDKLITPEGQVVFDEKLRSVAKIAAKNQENRTALSDLKAWANNHGIPASVEQLFSGDYPLGAAAVGNHLARTLGPGIKK